MAATAATTKKTFLMKGVLKTLRQRWRKGTYTSFDELLSEIAQVNLEAAQKIRETWESLDFLAYDKKGFIVWYGGP